MSSTGVSLSLFSSVDGMGLECSFIRKSRNGGELLTALLMKAVKAHNPSNKTMLRLDEKLLDPRNTFK